MPNDKTDIQWLKDEFESNLSYAWANTTTCADDDSYYRNTSAKAEVIFVRLLAMEANNAGR